MSIAISETGRPEPVLTVEQYAELQAKIDMLTEELEELKRNAEEDD